ncbi:MAG: glycosyltransferase family 2 protein [Candidatus Omnitrophica bacterium]|nr:glycosyltransferase family 2 protein [Candidatus Omnitrophota bacterium]
MDISIVIVNWNAEQYLERCLKSIADAVGDLVYEVIVLDNDSSDNSLKILKKFVPDVKIIESKENLGFGRGVNYASDRASGEFLVIMNPDIKIMKEAFKEIHSFFKSHPEAGIVGPKIINPDGSLQALGGGESPLSLWAAFNHYFFLAKKMGHIPFFRGIYVSGETQIPLEVGWVTGACFMIRNSLFKEIGMFDEDFFMYSEDVDLCYRVKKKGWKIFYIPDAEVVHYLGVSTFQVWDKIIAQQGNNTVRLFRKHRGKAALFIFRTFLSFGFVLRIFITYFKYIFSGKSIFLEKYKYLKKCFKMVLK